MAWYNPISWFTPKPAPTPAPAPIKEYAPLPTYVPSKTTSETLSTPLAPITTTSSSGGGSSSYAPPPTPTTYIPSKITPETLSAPLAPIEDLSGGQPTVYKQTGTTQEQMRQSKADKPFYVSDKRETPTQYGALFVTEKEAQKLQGTGVPYWVIESKDKDRALREAEFASNIPYISSGRKTRGVYEYNIQNIIAGKKVFEKYEGISKEFKEDPTKFKGVEGFTETKTKEGMEYSLSPKYFESQINMENIYSSSLKEAKTEFKDLPKSTQRELNIKGYGTGIAQAGLGIAEFGGTIMVNLGQQTFKKGEGFKSRKFFLGGKSGEIMTSPSIRSTVKFTESPKQYLKEKSGSPQVLGQATVIVPLIAQGARSLVSNIKRYGKKGGIVETTSAFSPLRIKSGVYSQPITTKTRFTNVESIKGTDKGITTRVFRGSSGSIKLTGAEKSVIIKGKKVGGGATITDTPYTEIGGGKIISGTRTTYSPYTFETTGSGSVFGAKGSKFYTQQLTPKYKGGTSSTLTSRGVTSYISPKGSKFYTEFNKVYRTSGGGATQKTRIRGVSTFLAGRSKPIYKTTFGDTRINLRSTTYTSSRYSFTNIKAKSSKDFIYEPSGRYKLEPQISGKEYDLNKIFSGKGGDYTSIGKGGTRLKAVTKFDTGISAIVPPSTKPTFKESFKLIPPTTKAETKPEIIRVKGSSVKIDTKIKTKSVSDTAGAVIIKSRGGTSIRSRQTPITTLSPVISTGLKPKAKEDTAIKDLQTPKIIEVQKVSLRSVSTSIFTGYGGTPAPTTFRPPEAPKVPVPFTLPLLSGMPGGALGIGRLKGGRSERTYTPSFKALFFKIKGKKPKGTPTGLRLRPITKGFSFTRKKKVKKVKRVRKVKK